jgi:hypothetical protein
MMLEDFAGGPISLAPFRRIEPRLAMAISVERTVYTRMGEAARDAGLSRQAFVERLVHAAWAARFGQCGDPELEAVVAAALKKVSVSAEARKQARGSAAAPGRAKSARHAAARSAVTSHGGAEPAVPAKRKRDHSRKNPGDAPLR